MLPLAWTLLSLALGQPRRIVFPDDATLDGPSERDRALWAVERDDVLSPADAALCARAPRGLARPTAAWCTALAEERALRREWAELAEAPEAEHAAAARLREAEARERSLRASLTAELRRQGGGPWATLLEARLELLIAEDRYAPDVAPPGLMTYEGDSQRLRLTDPALDVHAAVDLYRGLIASSPTTPEADLARYMLATCLGRPAAMPYEPDESQALLAELLDRRPPARLAAGADYLLGREHLLAGALDEAAASFQRIVDRGPREPLYTRALLALARASARTASNPVEVEQALDQHARLIDETPRLRRRGRAPPGLDPVREMAATVLVLADRGAADEGDPAVLQTPVDLALSWIAANGEPGWSRALAVAVGDLLVEQARYEEAIAARRAALARWPFDEQAPAQQRQIAQLHVSMVPPRLDLAREALIELATTYGEGSPWAVANRKDPEAVAEARAWVAEALVVAGANLHELADLASAERDLGAAGRLLGLADPTRDWIDHAIQDNYSRAASLYEQYLAQFPQAAEYHEIQSYLAQVLVYTRHIREAERVYEQLLAAPGHPYRDQALWHLMQSRREILAERYGAVETRPPDAEVERRVTLPSGRERIIYKLDPDHQRLIEVCDQLLAAELTDPTYVEAVEEVRPALAYLPAEILFHYGRFDEARPRLIEVMERWPKHYVANNAAHYIIDSYAEEENSAALRGWFDPY